MAEVNKIYVEGARILQNEALLSRSNDDTLSGRSMLCTHTAESHAARLYCEEQLAVGHVVVQAVPRQLTQVQLSRRMTTGSLSDVHL